MGETSSKHRKNTYRMIFEKPGGKGHFGVPGVYGSTIKNLGVRMWYGFTQLNTGSSGGISRKWH